MKDIVTTSQNKLLKALSGKINEFYLGGGTALSLYYFHHRNSLDLDFFTADLNKKRLNTIIQLISSIFKSQPKLIGQSSGKNKVKIFVYSLAFHKKQELKIDFIEDYLNLINPVRSINGINVLSLEDIYLRKIYAITGTIIETDSIGRKLAKGGRQEAKDFYDLFCLSQIFMKLSNFSFKYGTPLIRELLVRWFRSYNRLDMKTGLLELGLKKNVDYADIERHFKGEIEKILEKEIEAV